MPFTGSFLEANIVGIITSSIHPINIIRDVYNQITFATQSLLPAYNMTSIQQYILTYPINSMGYSGSIPREFTPLPTQSGFTVPTVGQVWPRGNR